MLNLSKLQKINASWSPPCLKINCDATVLDNNASIAFVIRNSDGHLIMVAGKPIISYSVTCAEILVAWWGLIEAIYTLGAMHIQLEGDPVHAISLLLLFNTNKLSYILY